MARVLNLRESWSMIVSAMARWRKSSLSAGDRAEIQRVRALGLQISNVYYTFGVGFAERPLNSPDPDVQRRNLEDFRRVAEFCTAIACPSVMLLPGVIHPGASKADAIQRCIEASRELLTVSQPAGIAIALEPHVMGLLESPRDTLAVLQGAPGLKLALDYAHFVTLGYTQADVDPLCAFAAHVHLRQAKPGFLQTRLEHGTLNFPAMLDALRRANYTGYLAVEYVHQDYMQTDNVDVISETVKMRDLARARLQGGYELLK